MGRVSFVGHPFQRAGPLSRRRLVLSFEPVVKVVARGDERFAGCLRKPGGLTESDPDQPFFEPFFGAGAGALAAADAAIAAAR